MVKNWYIASAVALGMAAATTAQAEEHIVVVTGFSYFPAISYVASGDTVRFVNESGEEQTVVGADVGWVVGPLQDQEEGTLTVTEETELRFFSAYADTSCNNGDSGTDGNCGDGNDEDPDYGDYDDAPIKAEITFDAAPLDG